MKELGLYIHVPFCLLRCNFCGFYLEIYREDRAELYLQAVKREIHLHATQGTLQGYRISTIYFGGGTPTTLPTSSLANILHQIFANFEVISQPEITVEAHPETVTIHSLQLLRETGVNRISFGMQSTHSQELLKIGRPSNQAYPILAAEQARQAGFINLNLDLMYGLPGQSSDSWHSTLQQATSLNPTHISCYALTIEERTYLEREIQRGIQTEPAADLQNEFEDLASEHLTSCNFNRYEISNYAQPSFHCRHNQHYWLGTSYLGLGPSAQSYLRATRFGNTPNLTRYAQELFEGHLPQVDLEVLSPRQALREASIFGLRLLEGIQRDRFCQKIDEEWETAIQQAIQDGFLEEQAGRIRLTSHGIRYMDNIAIALS